MKIEIDEKVLLQLFEDSAILTVLYGFGLKHYSIYSKVDLEKTKRYARSSPAEAKRLNKILGDKNEL